MGWGAQVGRGGPSVRRGRKASREQGHQECLAGWMMSQLRSRPHSPFSQPGRQGLPLSPIWPGLQFSPLCNGVTVCLQEMGACKGGHSLLADMPGLGHLPPFAAAAPADLLLFAKPTPPGLIRKPSGTSAACSNCGFPWWKRGKVITKNSHGWWIAGPQNKATHPWRHSRPLKVVKHFHFMHFHVYQKEKKMYHQFIKSMIS